MAGLGREVIAAKDCIDKNNVPMACKHWRGLLAIVDKMGPPLDENRGDIEQLMQERRWRTFQRALQIPRLTRFSIPRQLEFRLRSQFQIRIGNQSEVRGVTIFPRLKRE